MNSEIVHWLQTKPQKLCVLGTSSKANQPWGCTVGYVAKGDGTIIIATHKGSKKWKNIKENPAISLVFGFDFTEPTIQCEGIATLVEEGDAFTALETFFYTENPKAAQFKSDDTLFISIKVTAGRYSDFREKPPRIEEFHV